jgi:hypothetical protein
LSRRPRPGDAFLLGPTIGEPVDTAQQLPGPSLVGALLLVHCNSMQAVFPGETFYAPRP